MTTYLGTSGNDSYAYLDDDFLLAFGGDGDDGIFGNTDSDFLFGGIGDDMLGGNAGNDILSGWVGNDSMTGDLGDDTLQSRGGSDFLFGEEGNDLLLSGAGNDYLDGCDPLSSSNTEQFDTLTGGIGADIFYLGNFSGNYYLGSGYATITDWQPLTDTIIVYGSSSQYTLQSNDFAVGSSALDTGIYLGDDLIAIVQDSTNVNLSYLNLA